METLNNCPPRQSQPTTSLCFVHKHIGSFLKGTKKSCDALWIPAAAAYCERYNEPAPLVVPLRLRARVGGGMRGGTASCKEQARDVFWDRSTTSLELSTHHHLQHHQHHQGSSAYHHPSTSVARRRRPGPASTAVITPSAPRSVIYKSETL